MVQNAKHVLRVKVQGRFAEVLVFSLFLSLVLLVTEMEQLSTILVQLVTEKVHNKKDEKLKLQFQQV